MYGIVLGNCSIAEISEISQNISEYDGNYTEFRLELFTTTNCSCAQYYDSIYFTTSIDDLIK